MEKRAEKKIPQESEIDPLASALQRAIEEKTREDARWTDESRKYLEDNLKPLIHVASLLTKGNWHKYSGQALILRLEEIAASKGLINLDYSSTKNHTLFTHIFRGLRAYQIHTSTIPKEVFIETVYILRTGKTTSEAHTGRNAGIKSQNDLYSGTVAARRVNNEEKQEFNP